MIKNPKVYLYELKEYQLPILYFLDGKAVGPNCPVCKTQHDSVYPATTGHTVPPNFDLLVLRKSRGDIVNVPREKWIDEGARQIECVIRAVWEGGFDGCNIFVFRKFLEDGTCDIGMAGMQKTAKKKTNEKLQAVSDNFIHRMNSLKAFW